MDWPGTLSISALDKLKVESAYDELSRAFGSRLLYRPAGPKYIMPSSANRVTVSVVEDTMETHTITLPPFVGTDLSASGLEKAATGATTWECTTCTPTSVICIGSLASLICITQNH